MFSILIPELVDSTKTLADNFESYYKTVYNWVNSLVENQAIFSDDIYSDQLLSALNGYYDKLVKWVTDTVIPQAQVAIVAVTAEITSSVISFFVPPSSKKCSSFSIASFTETAPFCTIGGMGLLYIWGYRLPSAQKERSSTKLLLFFRAILPKTGA